MMTFSTSINATLSSINVYSRLFVDDDESFTGTCQTRIA
jgi:hypothetical protein